MTESTTSVLAERLFSDVGAFAEFVGSPLTPTQVAAFTLAKRETVLCSPRQAGKSRSLAVVALWWAFRRRNQFVLIVSASEAASKDLLAKVRLLLNGPLTGSVVDEGKSEIVLDNGSVIRSVPCSPLAIRGTSPDLLIVDEAAQVPDMIIRDAAEPSQNARPEGRRVYASTPFGQERAFAEDYLLGIQGHPHIATVRWSLEDCPWIASEIIEDARSRLPRWKFAQEYLGEFAAGSGGYFDPDDLARAVAPYPLVPPHRATGGTVIAGLDWGRSIDSHAITLVGCLDDYGMNHAPVIYVPYVEASQRKYAEQVEIVLDLAKGGLHRGRAHLWGATQGRRISSGPVGYDVASIFSEKNGVGFMATEGLRDVLGHKVQPVTTSATTKEENFSYLLSLLSSGQMVLPNEPTLLRELNGLTAEPLPSGHIRIAASGSNHDDLAMSLSLCMNGLADDGYMGHVTPLAMADTSEIENGYRTASGLFVPANPKPRIGGMGRAKYTVRGF